MSNSNEFFQGAYGATQPIIKVFPLPIISNRLPTVRDIAPIGSIWVVPSTNQVFILTSIVAGAATWSGAGGAASFSTLTSTGATTLATTGASVNTFGNTTGATSVTILVGTGGFTLDGVGASVFAIGASTTTGTITIGGTGANTGAFSLAPGTGAQTITIAASGTGAKTITIGATGSVDVVSIGSTTGASSLALLAGTAGLSLSAGGAVSVVPATSSTASPTAAVTMNIRVGVATFTGFTTANAGGVQAYTITNNTILTTSGVHVTVANLNASTNGAFLTITGITQAAGSIIVHTANNGAGALGAGDNVLVNFWVIS